MQTNHVIGPLEWFGNEPRRLRGASVQSFRALFSIRALGELHVLDEDSTKGVAMLRWRNRGASREGWLLAPDS